MNSKTGKTRVAVYIRIGGSGEYASVFEVQKIHFTAVINQNPDWESAGFYADLGADSRKQPNLRRLVADCRAGRIDLVITKSVSRISRNMNALMDIVRELAYLKPPVGIYFEDTELNTLSKDNFLFLTMFEVMSVEAEHSNAARLSLVQYAKARKKLLEGKQRGNKQQDKGDETHD